MCAPPFFNHFLDTFLLMTPLRLVTTPDVLAALLFTIRDPLVMHTSPMLTRLAQGTSGMEMLQPVFTAMGYNMDGQFSPTLHFF